MRPNVLHLTLAAALVTLAASLPAHAAGKTCSDAAVSARGEPARFMWLAKTKARLEAEGLIEFYAAHLDPARLGLAVQAFVQVQMTRHGAETSAACLADRS